jgi:glycogen(starch) synthase
VASWYPAVDDVAAGRFVADQVAALEATGEATVEVVSFDIIPLVGGATARAGQVGAVHQAIATAIATERKLFVRVDDGDGRSNLVARLGVAVGSTPALGTTAAATHRAAALEALAGRLLADPVSLPDVVHAHPGYPDGAAAAVLAGRIDRPLVFTEHATFLDRILADPGQRAQYAEAGLRASRIIAVSELLAAQIRDALPELSARIVIVPNTVAVEEFQALDLTDRIADELLYVGYRKEIKGIDTLLDAVAIVHAARPTARLRLIGRSPTDEIEQAWHRRAEDLGLTDVVSFEDVADRAGVAAAMARASIFVHPSRYETFGVVAAEALAAGLPLVATDSGGVGEIVGPDPDAVGALVPVGDARALGAAILRTLERRDSFDPATLRQSVVGRFGARAVAATLLGLYDDVLDEHDGGRSRTDHQAVAAREAPPETASDRARPQVILGLDRAAAAERLGVLSRGLLASLSLVTSGEPRSVRLPPVGRIVELPIPSVAPTTTRRRPATGIRTVDRLLRFALDPLGTLRRRMGGDPLGAVAIGRASNLVDGAIAEVAGRGGMGAGGVEIVALDGRDVLVAAQLVRTGANRLSPGGLRRLADRWRAAGSADPT